MSRAARIKPGAWVALGVLAFLLLAGPLRRQPRPVIEVRDEADNLLATSELDPLP